MANKNESGLQHVPGRAGLSVHSRAAGIIARGRRDAADAAANPHYLEAIAAYSAGNFTTAAASFRLAAEQGHAESQYVLSTMYDEGEGVPQDDAQSAHWERKAAEQGHAYAQANLSFRYYNAENFADAFAWCQRAAYSQLPWAQYNLGLMYRKGEGVAQSNVEAAHWYRLAAAQNFAEAQQKLAELYYTEIARVCRWIFRAGCRVVSQSSRWWEMQKRSSSWGISMTSAREWITTTHKAATGIARPPNRATS